MALPPHIPAFRSDGLFALSLCAGAGGLDLGVRIAEPRARTVCYVEREAYAAASLVARMEDEALDRAPVWSDVGTFDARAFCGGVDLVTSGDPCQPNSVAGSRKGDSDDRWLIDQVLRVFSDSGASRLFRENVTGNSDGQLQALVPALESMGCRVAAGIFSAEEVGASHRRERLFIMADRAGGGFGEFGLPARPGRGGHADGGDEALADAGRSERRAETGPRHQPDRHDGGREEAAGRAGECDAAMGDAAMQSRVDRAVSGRPEGRRRALGGSGGELGHPLDDGRAGARLHAGQGRKGRGTAGADGAGASLAHPGEPGLSSAERDALQRAGRGEEGRAATEFCGTLPLYAPGPGSPEWGRILDAAPCLEPALHRMADGLASGLDGRIYADLRSRADRLRLTGNGVFPLAAALAYRSLDACLASAEPGHAAVRMSA